MGGFAGLGKCRVIRQRSNFGVATRRTDELETVGVVAQAIDGCRGKQPTAGERLVPFVKVEI